MALTNLTLEQLDSNIEKFLMSQSEFQKRVSWLKNQVLVSPTMEIQKYDFTKLVWPRGLSLNERIFIGVFSWYLPEEVRFAFHFALEENWGGDFKEVKEVLLLSKRTALGYLLVQDRFNEFDLFGNILSKNSTILRNFRLVRFQEIKQSRKGIKRINFCDYKDKGSCRPDSNPEPVYDYRKLLTVDQLIERELALQAAVEALLSEIEVRLKAEIA